VAGRLLRVALTGGIATGKSYCAARLASLGAHVIDADDLAREAVEPGTDALATVAARFGGAVLHPDGTLNRAALASIVFKDEQARRDLEAILHPEVYRRIRQWFEALAAAADETTRVGIASIPLLYETGRERDFDHVVVVACPADQQLHRLMARDDLGEAEARQRLASQWPIDEKARRADIVIDTSGTFERTDREVDAAWRRLNALADA
jgi:dephospho-CoA kinase